jgi:transposase
MEKRLEGEDKVRMLEREMRGPSGGGACPKCGNINHRGHRGHGGKQSKADESAD